VRFGLARRELPKLAIDPLKRRLKALEMLEHQVFDILRHRDTLT
jgi:hypothetical protein